MVSRESNKSVHLFRTVCRQEQAIEESKTDSMKDSYGEFSSSKASRDSPLGMKATLKKTPCQKFSAVTNCTDVLV